MFDFTRSLGLTLALSVGLVWPALAQETTTQAPAAPAPATQVPATPAPAATTEAPIAGTELSTGQPVDTAANQPYVKSTIGDWDLRCIKTQDGSDPCELYQLLKDDKGNSVAEITMIALPDGQQAAAGATIVVPLETLLPQQLTLAIDGKNGKHYPFTFCAAVGCFARIGIVTAEIDAMKSGKIATVSVVPVAAPDKVVSVNISLKGFTDAFTAVLAERPAAKKP